MKISVLFLLLLPATLKAQTITWESAEISVEGLTCSFCSRNVEMALRKLDFIEEVKMDLEKTMGIITFKKGITISPAEIRKSIYDSGFILGKIILKGQGKGIKGQTCLDDNGMKYQIITDGKDPGDGAFSFLVVNKKFLSTKEGKDLNTKINPSTACGTTKDVYYISLLH